MLNSSCILNLKWKTIIIGTHCLFIVLKEFSGLFQITWLFQTLSLQVTFPQFFEHTRVCTSVSLKNAVSCLSRHEGWRRSWSCILNKQCQIQRQQTDCTTNWFKWTPMTQLEKILFKRGRNNTSIVQAGVYQKPAQEKRGQEFHPKWLCCLRPQTHWAITPKYTFCLHMFSFKR